MVDYDYIPVIVDQCQFSPGDRVRVKCGPLMDRDCELVEVLNKKYVAVSLSVLGYARLELPISNIEMIDN